MGKAVFVSHLPQRIVSLVPSQTELLFDLGLENRVVGITKFCVHPQDKVKNIPIVGGTKNFNFELIETLQPDLIIGNKEENYKEGILELQQNYPVWMSDMATLPDVYAMMSSLGHITDRTEQAAKLIKIIQAGFKKLKDYPLIPTAYFIWKNPYMSVGHDTFIHEMMKKAGFQNVFDCLSRYPEITPDILQAANPKLILLSSEPYPFKEKHIQEFKKICPEATVQLVDGELFSWYGSRLQYAAAYFMNIRERLNIEGYV